MKNVLVTGGIGYIGSHVCVELLQKNYNVVVVDNLSNSRYEVLDAIEAITHIRPTFYQVNVGETEQMTEILQSHRIDVVIHLAAYKSVEGSIKNPQLFYDNNASKGCYRRCKRRLVGILYFLPLQRYMGKIRRPMWKLWNYLP